MSNVSHIKGNVLNSSNLQRIVIHSCNCRGSWGGGIAYQLAQRYPKAEQVYRNICEKYNERLLGKCLLIPSFESENLIICCLFTSTYGGSVHDQQSSILENTLLALDRLRNIIYRKPNFLEDNVDKKLDILMRNLDENLSNYNLEMPKINSGIFGVPWEKTEQLLGEYSTGEHPLHFDVFSL